MRYMMLIYTTEAAWQERFDERERVREGHRAVMMEARAKGLLLAADPLKPIATATTVRTQNGSVLVTDGPFAETKEQLAGYYILDCANLDEAIEWAAKMPTGCGGAAGCVEIRPIADMNSR